VSRLRFACCAGAAPETDAPPTEVLGALAPIVICTACFHRARGLRCEHAVSFPAHSHDDSMRLAEPHARPRRQRG
jgi:hypothetical protein